MNNVALAGPTLFAPIISNAIERASNPPNSQAEQRYEVLLILCDGIINDMDATIDQIIAASRLPLSIIIIGVGTADFTDMDVLDADDGFLSNSLGQHAQRDIVQFVPFRDYKNNPTLLAAEVLKELPGQVTEYMKMTGFVPNEPIPPVVVAPPEMSSEIGMDEMKVQDDLPAPVDPNAPPPDYTG